MADNIELNSTSGGPTAATDDIGGAHFQRIKLIFGADGTNEGDVASANPLPTQSPTATDTDTEVTVTDSETEIVTIDTTGKKTLVFQCTVADQNLADFAVYVQCHASAVLIDFTPSWAALAFGARVKEAQVSASTGAAVDGDLDTIEATQNGYFRMDVEGLVAVKVAATAAVTGAGVTPFWSLQ